MTLMLLHILLTVAVLFVVLVTSKCCKALLSLAIIDCNEYSEDERLLSASFLLLISKFNQYSGEWQLPKLGFKFPLSMQSKDCQGRRHLFFVK
jgi:hypothetical protein